VTEGAREQGRGVGEIGTRLAAWPAWSLCALCVALAAASPILGLLNRRTLGEVFTALGGPSIVAIATLIAAFSVVGALIASHRPENPIGWIFLTVGFFYGLLIAADEYAIYALLTNPGSLPLGAEASWLGQWIWAPGLGLILVFLPLLFPDGHPPSHRWRPVAWLGGLSIGLAVVSSAILLWPERGPALVTGDESPSHVVQVLVVFVASPLMLLAGVGAVISLFVRFRWARGDGRQQIKWFASAAALTLVWILVFGQSTLRGLPGVIVDLSALVVIPSIPIATGIAILRYRLYDIDRIINRTLVYGALTAMLVALYFGGIVVLQRIFVILTGQQSTLAVVASTLAIAALFVPLRRKVQGFVDRRFYRKKYDARKTLEAFSAKLRDETDLEALNSELVGVVRETMQPAHVSLWLRPEASPKGTQAG
jgi:MFS family permease